MTITVDLLDLCFSNFYIYTLCYPDILDVFIELTQQGRIYRMAFWASAQGPVDSRRPRLSQDGNLYIELPTSIPPWTVRTPDEYCLDTFVTEEDGVNKTRLDALVCFASQTEDSNYVISISCMLISCFFILLTVGVYSWLPELRNLHGRVLTAYLLSLFVGFTFLATMQLLITLHQITTDMCLMFNVAKELPERATMSNIMGLHHLLFAAGRFLLVECDVLRHLVDLQVQHISSVPKDEYFGHVRVGKICTDASCDSSRPIDLVMKLRVAQRAVK
ncbi:G-protein coupled receptor Mth2 [Eumeta japonica]|uniref:G-protein coupled receptor Mth2 n=1 Tax=Eumeta variegata TaxID=151549 RepID=A0A4C1Z917_EUMVA|nr:G-protein coupled receptor Mth2 [Eumeta japonica]